MEHSAPNVFKELFHIHYPVVRRKLIALIRDEAAAEDLAQEVFLKLYRYPPDNPEAVGAWLHRVLTRTAYDYMDKRARERALIEKQEQSLQTAGAAGPSSEQAVMEKAAEAEMQQLLDALPERDRHLLMLRYAGYSYAEIAQKLEVRRPQVGTLLRRAGAKLKRQAAQAEH